MTIITVDDERAPLNMITNAVKNVCANATVSPFMNGNEAYEYAKENTVDVAFLDIQMRQMSGLDLAKKLQDINPKVNIIFVTGFNEYGIDAVQLHASGYLEKPVDEEDVEKAMQNLLYPVDEENKLFIQVFGKFEVFYKGKPLKFERTKSKELLAYLVNLKGASASKKEICAVLFEDEEYTRAQQGYFTKIYNCLNATLNEIGVDNLLIHEINNYSVNMSAFDSDIETQKESLTQYMEQYSWAEGYAT